MSIDQRGSSSRRVNRFLPAERAEARLEFFGAVRRSRRYDNLVRADLRPKLRAVEAGASDVNEWLLFRGSVSTLANARSTVDHLTKDKDFQSLAHVYLDLLEEVVVTRLKLTWKDEPPIWCLKLVHDDACGWPDLYRRKGWTFNPHDRMNAGGVMGTGDYLLPENLADATPHDIATSEMMGFVAVRKAVGELKIVVGHDGASISINTKDASAETSVSASLPHEWNDWSNLRNGAHDALDDLLERLSAEFRSDPRWTRRNRPALERRRETAELLAALVVSNRSPIDKAERQRFIQFCKLIELDSPF